MAESRTGTLFLVATPIGNLEDISMRALRVLREVGTIAAEDTRRSGKLLHHFGIRTRTLSLHDHNENERTPALIARLLAGESVALVSDAGTPAVSDPGFRVVRSAIEAGIRVESIPGPSAVMVAVTASGLPTDSFVFLGFPPARSVPRRAWFEALRAESRTMVLFEAPHRVRATLTDALAALGARPAAVGRELTKLHETWLRGPLDRILQDLEEPRGEFTIVLAGADASPSAEDGAQVTDLQVLEAFELHAGAGLDRREAVTAAARQLGLRPREVYAAVERARRS